MKIAAWLGTIFSIAGAFWLALGMGVCVAYILFTLGSGIWMIIGLIRGDKPLCTLNFIFVVADLIGLYRAII